MVRILMILVLTDTESHNKQGLVAHWQSVCLACKQPAMCFKLYEPHHEKKNVLASNLVRHKPGCTGTEDG